MTAFKVLLSVGTAICLVYSNDGCLWTGNMTGPGGGGPCPSPMASETCPVTPTYQQLGNLWPCPAATNTTYYGSCTTGSGSNPLCTFSTTQLGCCCPSNGCYTPPYFNWIIAACKGSGCGSYATTQQTQAHKDAGTQLLVNYIATYQWNSAAQSWMMLRDSSFNTDGSLPPFDAALPDGGLNQSSAWLKPQPGGAMDWTWGYYPAGVQGAGPPGMMFVLSVEKVWNMAWYMLNQVTLDKGPAFTYPSEQCTYGSDNCLASGNAGIIGLLESPWTVNAGAIDNYRRLYATQWKQVGRSFIGERGSTCHADGGWFGETVATNNYFLGTVPNATNPYVFVAVVDRVGTFIYRIPAAQINQIWPGLSHTTAACSLVSRPTQRPPNNGPPCDDSNPYCALFLPNCQSAAWGGASAGYQGGANQGCNVNPQQGWCENWWSLMDNTGQWLWPANGRQSVVQFQAPASAVSMPWNYEMESWLVSWTGSAQLDAGCCVVNQGRCPSSVVKPISSGPQPTVSISSSLPTASIASTNSTPLIVGVVVGVSSLLAAMLFVLLMAYFLHQYHRSKKANSQTPPTSHSHPLSAYTLYNENTNGTPLYEEVGPPTLHTTQIHSTHPVHPMKGERVNYVKGGYIPLSKQLMSGSAIYTDVNQNMSATTMEEPSTTHGIRIPSSDSHAREVAESSIHSYY